MGNAVNKVENSTMAESAIDPDLFTRDGEPLYFYMTPGSERSKIAPLIKQGGGVLSSRVSYGNAIKLCDSGLFIRESERKNFFLSKFITDCAKENRLLDMEKYKVSNNKVVRHRKEDWTSDISDISADEANPLIVQGQTKDKAGRKRYTLGEDMKILDYVLEDKRFLEATGNKIWRDAEMLEVTAHSWQSMRDHYAKHIVPRIETYNIPIHKQYWLRGLPVPDRLARRSEKPVQNGLPEDIRTIKIKVPKPIAASSPKWISKRDIRDIRNSSSPKPSTSKEVNTSCAEVQSLAIDSSPNQDSLDSLDGDLLEVADANAETNAEAPAAETPTAADSEDDDDDEEITSERKYYLRATAHKPSSPAQTNSSPSRANRSYTLRASNKLKTKAKVVPTGSSPSRRGKNSNQQNDASFRVVGEITEGITTRSKKCSDPSQIKKLKPVSVLLSKLPSHPRDTREKDESQLSEKAEEDSDSIPEPVCRRTRKRIPDSSDSEQETNVQEKRPKRDKRSDRGKRLAKKSRKADETEADEIEANETDQDDVSDCGHGLRDLVFHGDGDNDSSQSDIFAESDEDDDADEIMSSASAGWSARKEKPGPRTTFSPQKMRDLVKAGDEEFMETLQVVDATLRWLSVTRLQFLQALHHNNGSLNKTIHWLLLCKDKD